MRADEFDIQAREAGEAHEIRRTREKTGKRGSECDLSCSREAHRHAYHVLLGNVSFEEPIGCDFLEELRVRGVLDVSIGTDHRLIVLPDLSKRLRRGFASSDFFAELILRGSDVPVRRVLFGFAARFGRFGLRGVGLDELLFQFGNCFVGFVFLQRLPVPAVVILNERHTLALERLGEDDSGPSFGALRLLEGFKKFADVMSIDDKSVPSEGRPALLINVHMVLKHGGLTLAETIHIDDRAEIIDLVMERHFSRLPH